MTDTPEEFQRRVQDEQILDSRSVLLGTMRDERDELIRANQAGFAEISRMGAQVDPANLLNTRLDILAQLVLGGTDSPGFIEFQVRFERQVAKVLEEIRGQVRKAQLAAGPAQFSPQQVRQMAQQQGLLGPNGQPIHR